MIFSSSVSPGPEPWLQGTWASVHHFDSSEGHDDLTQAFACIYNKQLNWYKTEYLKYKLTIQGLLLRREKSSWEQIPRWLKTEFLIFSQYTISSFLPIYPGQSPETINHLSEGITLLLLGFHFLWETFFTGILHRLFILQAERKSILLELWNHNHCGFGSWFYYFLSLEQNSSTFLPKLRMMWYRLSLRKDTQCIWFPFLGARIYIIYHQFLICQRLAFCFD